MSSLRGLPGERWTLAHAVDAMSAAVRQVRRPALLWLPGYVYPGISLLAGNGGMLAVTLLQPQGVRDELLSASVAIEVAGTIVFSRFVAGTAALGAAETWEQATGTRRAPRLRDAWRAGRGLGWTALGLWIQILLMLVLVGFVCLAPPLYALEHVAGIDPKQLTEEQAVLGAVVLGPFVGVVLGFGFVLSIIYQLALQSLVHNRRGVTSALLHGWRIARADPWATTRAVIVDFLLSVTVVILSVVFSLLLIATCVGCVVFWVPPILMTGFKGVARAAYWARVYRALGGLSPADQVPGLHPSGTLPESVR